MTAVADRLLRLAVAAAAAGVVAALLAEPEAGRRAGGTRPPIDGARDAAPLGTLAVPPPVGDAREARTREPDSIAKLVAVLLRRDDDAADGTPADAADALRALGRAPVDALRTALRTSSGVASSRLLVCLGRLGVAAAAAAEDVAARLRGSHDDDERALAARTLGAFGSGAIDALPDLRALLNDAVVDRPTRVDAARALAAVGGGTSAFEDACLAALADRRRDVRAAMLCALEDRVSDAGPCRRRLLDLLDDDEPEVRRHAASLIGGLGPADDDAVRALSCALDVEGPSEVGAFARALAGLGPEGVAELVRLAAVAESRGVRLVCVRALDRAGFPVRDHLDLLTALLDSPETSGGGKIQALSALADLHPPARAGDALPALRRLAPEPGSVMRLAAMRAVATLEQDAAAVVGYLLDALGEEGDTGALAASQLGRFPTEAARVVPALLDALAARPRDRAIITSSLRALAVADAGARARVASAAARADGDVRTWIAEALGGSAPDDR